MNGSLFLTVEATKLYHSHILTLLGTCYMEAGNYQDALALLDKSLRMNRQIMGETHESNAQILMVIGSVCSKCQEYDRAVRSLTDALQILSFSQSSDQRQVECNLELALAF